MRRLPDTLAEALTVGGAVVARAWILTRSDGVRLGFTDHDEDIVVEGVTCAAASAWTAGAAHTEQGVSPGLAAATGALDSASLTEADIAAGRYDGAAVEHYRVVVGERVERLRLWRGVISRLVRTGPGVTAELEGPIEALTRVVGRTYGRSCDAILGDARCRVARDHADVARGCDKRFETCRTRFGNALNFQGFPDIPGDDFLAVTPQAGAVNDGGSRR